MSDQVNKTDKKRYTKVYRFFYKILYEKITGARLKTAVFDNAGKRPKVSRICFIRQK
ncbi:hypothetical protein CHK_2727 [Christensenella hongkongensis]|uniref:Uncharacterized protein n=1 Tax=Christensenella hongkongensis TaxID=270498 RepID=A0A0M2NHB8_9FIRM|nr:hypothetical protein CHK_2727 [Christensenella hongkongensis]